MEGAPYHIPSTQTIRLCVILSPLTSPLAVRVVRHGDMLSEKENEGSYRGEVFEVGGMLVFPFAFGSVEHRDQECDDFVIQLSLGCLFFQDSGGLFRGHRLSIRPV